MGNCRKCNFSNRRCSGRNRQNDTGAECDLLYACACHVELTLLPGSMYPEALRHRLSSCIGNPGEF